MRLSNEGDQKLIRSAVSDAAANLLSFIPSLGTREVFTFGSGVALPTRMRFAELAADKRPNSEASGNTRSDAGTNMNRDLLTTVIERWRSASMSHRVSDDLYDDAPSPFDSPALQPAQVAAPAYAPPQPSPGASLYAPSQPPASSMNAPQPRPDGLRSSLLKKPLAESLNEAPRSPMMPSRFR